MAHVEQPDCSACGIDIKRFRKHNFLVPGQLVIVGPGARAVKCNGSSPGSCYSVIIKSNPLG